MSYSNGHAIPRHQAKMYACTCGLSTFEIIKCVQFVYDRLQPDGAMNPIPAAMYRCMGCQGFLMRDKTGAYKIVHTDDADSWKNPPADGEGGE